MHMLSIQTCSFPWAELEEGLADILTFAQAMFGGMNDARDGFASDIEHEKDVDDFF